MARLIGLTKSGTPAILADLLPRGPVWDRRQGFLGALLAGLNEVVIEVYNRMLDLIDESDPRTTSELLGEWLTAFGLPEQGQTLPTTEEGQRALLVGKVTAQGGQSRDYSIQVVRTILDDDAAVVTITERPYGPVFSAWVSDAWDDVVGTPLMHHWWVTVPIADTDPRWDAIERVLALTKPAHTVVTLVDGS